MRVESITMEDLLAFKAELFQELQSILGSQPGNSGEVDHLIPVKLTT